MTAVTVKISIAGQPETVVDVRDSAMEAVRLTFNPSGLHDVTTLKALAAAFLSQVISVGEAKPESDDLLREARKFAISASMWSVLGATRGL